MSKQSNVESTTAKMSTTTKNSIHSHDAKVGYGRSSAVKTLEKAAKIGDYKEKMQDLRNTMTPAMRAATMIQNPFYKSYPAHGTSDVRAYIDGKICCTRTKKCGCGRSVFGDKYI